MQHCETDLEDKLASRLTGARSWRWYPLVLFAASRCCHLAFALAAPLFGPRLGADPSLSPAFLQAYPTWAALAHGDISNYARIARAGYTVPGDYWCSLLFPSLGKGLGTVLGSVEIALFAISLVFCAVAFVGVYRVIEELCDAVAARWGLALLAAFPLSYHLSDGTALGALVAFSAWGILLAARGRRWAAALVVSLGVLAHPLCVFSGIAIAWSPVSRVAQGPGLTGTWRSRLLALVPVAVLFSFMGWLVSGRHFAAKSMLDAVFPSKADVLPESWYAIMVVFGGLLGAGALIMTRRPGQRILAIVAAAQLLFASAAREPSSAYALAACWPAFLGLGDLLARRDVLRGPAIAMLATHQGLLFYCFTHFLRLA